MNIESSGLACQGMESYPIYPQGYAQAEEWLREAVPQRYKGIIFTFWKEEIFS
jgi:hypothetical protein